MGRVDKYSVCVFFYCLRVAVSRTKILWKKKQKKIVDVILPIVFYCISLVPESWF